MADVRKVLIGEWNNPDDAFSDAVQTATRDFCILRHPERKVFRWATNVDKWLFKNPWSVFWNYMLTTKRVKKLIKESKMSVKGKWTDRKTRIAEGDEYISTDGREYQIDYLENGDVYCTTWCPNDTDKIYPARFTAKSTEFFRALKNHRIHKKGRR